jgi:hypothetical protein
MKKKKYNNYAHMSYRDERRRKINFQKRKKGEKNIWKKLFTIFSNHLIVLTIHYFETLYFEKRIK